MLPFQNSKVSTHRFNRMDVFRVQMIRVNSMFTSNDQSATG